MQKMSESKLQIHIIIILLAQCALVCKYHTKSVLWYANIIQRAFYVNIQIF